MILLRDLCDTMLNGSLCAMGGMTPFPVLSALEPFPAGLRHRDARSPSRLKPEEETSHARTISRKPTTAPPSASPSARSRWRSTATQVTVPAGTSVMRAAVDAGIQVPKLCATDSLEPFGSCRLCLVEIDGRKGYPASCTTPAEAGMKVRTQTPKLQELRKGVMELYISDHPLDCLTCPANGNCELQDMAGVTGLRDVRYGFDGANHLKQREGRVEPVLHLRPVASASSATAACAPARKRRAPSR